MCRLEELLEFEVVVLVDGGLGRGLMAASLWVCGRCGAEVNLARCDTVDSVSSSWKQPR